MKAITNDDDRFVFTCKADNQNLPFEENTFDSYIANMSVHLVPDPNA